MTLLHEYTLGKNWNLCVQHIHLFLTGLAEGVVRDESISFSPSAEKSTVDGGIVARMSSLSCKQHLQGLKQNKAYKRKSYSEQ